MKKLLFSLLILMIFNNICAQEMHYGDTVQISYTLIPQHYYKIFFLST